MEDEMAWQVVTLTAKEAESLKHVQLQGAFEKVFQAAGCPVGAAMFSAKRKNRHLGFRYYFSPGAVAIFGPILAAYGAEETPPPAKDEVNLLGPLTSQAWDLVRAAA
jgi:hypothetical protein